MSKNHIFDMSDQISSRLPDWTLSGALIGAGVLMYFFGWHLFPLSCKTFCSLGATLLLGFGLLILITSYLGRLNQENILNQVVFFGALSIVSLAILMTVVLFGYWHFLSTVFCFGSILLGLIIQSAVLRHTAVVRLRGRLDVVDKMISVLGFVLCIGFLVCAILSDLLVATLF